MKRLRCRVKYILCTVCLVSFLYSLGLMTFLVETDYKYFQYPLDINIMSVVKNLELSGYPEIRPINYYNFTFISDCAEKCLQNQLSTLRVIFLVKSAVDHFDRRRAIRKTWGFEKRFSDVPIRTVFILGHTLDDEVQGMVELEQAEFRDIIQASFVDSYYNNTLKTMMAIKWAVKSCSNSRFYFFVDDDYYVSTKNLLKFLRNPLEYPAYLEMPVMSVKDKRFENRQLNQVIDIELPDDAELYAGYVFPNSKPQRFIFSKWYISVSEYPYSRYPPYVTAGAFVLSKRALVNMYYTSFFTKHFRFDDIFIGILAKKVDIAPLHSSEFHFYRRPDPSPLQYKHVVASHGFSDPLELTNFWDKQKMAGNA